MSERSETNEFWREIREEERAGRRAAYARDMARLQALVGQGKIMVHRFNPHHVRISAARPNVHVDFWPSTGRWRFLGGAPGGVGLTRMLTLLGVEEVGAP